MSAPINDLFANAIVITGQTGTITGSNISASAESGEPHNSGSTVWYEWQPSGITFGPTNGNVYFSTLNGPTFRTILRAYTATGSTVNTLVETPYINAPVWNASYGHTQYGSQIAINFTNGTNYYVRVDSLVSGSSGQGNFELDWGIYYNRSLNACNVCPPFLQVSAASGSDGYYTCVSTAQVSNETISPQNFSFGNIPSGSYLVKWCKGCTHWGLFSVAQWASVYNVATNPFAFLKLSYFDISSGPTTASFDNVPANSVYWSQAECENNSVCIQKSINHTGGAINLCYQDTDPSNDGPGIPSTLFGLYKFHPIVNVTAVAASCASWVTAGVSGSISFELINGNGNAWSGISATLLNTGGISGGSTVTGLSLPAHGVSSAFGFTFECTTAEVTATLVLSCAEWTSNITQSIYLGPILSVYEITPPAKDGNHCTISGGTYTTWASTIAIQNSGLWTITPVIDTTATSGLVVDGSCNIISSSMPITTTCNHVSTYGIRMAFSSQITVNFNYYDQGVNMLSFSHTFIG